MGDENVVPVLPQKKMQKENGWPSSWKFQQGHNPAYYVTLSHKDWEPLNSQIWLAEIHIDRGLDFHI